MECAEILISATSADQLGCPFRVLRQFDDVRLTFAFPPITAVSGHRSTSEKCIRSDVWTPRLGDIIDWITDRARRPTRVLALGQETDFYGSQLLIHKLPTTITAATITAATIAAATIAAATIAAATITDATITA